MFFPSFHSSSAPPERISPAAIEPRRRHRAILSRTLPWSFEPALRKLIAFDDDTFDKLTQLGRDRMATLQDLADEAFADLLKKHGVPVDLEDALRRSAGVGRKTTARAK